MFHHTDVSVRENRISLPSAETLFADCVLHDGWRPNIRQAASRLRYPPLGWGLPVPPVGELEPTVPAHIGVSAVGAPDGVLVTVSCRCGARIERLLEHAGNGWRVVHDGVPSEDSFAALAAKRAILPGFQRDHAACISSPMNHSHLVALVQQETPSWLEHVTLAALDAAANGEVRFTRLGAVFATRDWQRGVSVPVNVFGPTSMERSLNLALKAFAVRELGRQLRAEPVAAYAILPLWEDWRELLDDPGAVLPQTASAWDVGVGLVVTTPACSATFLATAVAPSGRVLESYLHGVDDQDCEFTALTSGLLASPYLDPAPS